MIILSYKLDFKDLDLAISNLQINDIFNVYYESPLEITTDKFGYGYLEKDDEPIILKVTHTDEDIPFENFKECVNGILSKEPIDIEEMDYTYEEFKMDPIFIDETWVLKDPNDSIPDKKEINFISQGAFGTGLHETTRDLLSLILKEDYTNMRILDIGTGSGILSLATAIKGAKEVLALDIRDIKDEVLLNASLNNIETITPLVGDALSGEVLISGKFDWIYINIGGEETELFMPFIKEHLKPNGKLLVSGLVEWSFDSVSNIVSSYGFNLLEKHKTNEWCTAIYK
ncbi:50S ribosomal protein L11 methyltransferase [Clostridium chrysemydis]|uniref:50S ribosomal protein L11 methyltransferase n=1 Tax=Clostridium chrysemydis TaxID=2665504 RepID=UPI00188438F0|nr:50S ribosomal protein L11 methyltransferase [Clostridium chrysemydis]